MNPLRLYVPPSKWLAGYEAIKQKLPNDNGIIFDVMESITRGSPNQFVPPSKSSEHAKKYREIDGLFKYRTVLGGTDLLVSLMDEICNRVLAIGGTPGLSIDELLGMARFPIANEAKVCLTKDAHWMAEWEIRVPSDDPDEKSPVILSVYRNGWGEIVPFYVVQYVSSALYSYNQRMYVAALALLSIAVEATLRDLLATKDYTFKRGASPVNVYDYSPAHVDVNGNSYTVTFLSNMPKSPAELSVSTGGSLPLEIRIRREVNYDSDFNLLIRTDQALVDHWSTDKIVQKAQKTVGGLGDALKYAREDEKIISTTDLPSDIDDVLKVVRNNLVHLSSEALDTVLPRYAQYSATGQFTLRDFISRPDMVYDLVANIPSFIQEQYMMLRAPKPVTS